MAGIELRGQERLIAALRRLGPASTIIGAKALYQIAEMTMTEAKQLTPVDTGALRASGHVVPPEINGSRVVVTLGFGNASVGYAIPVHENMSAHHPTGQAKYLEQPVLARAKTLEADMAALIQRELPNAAR